MKSRLKKSITFMLCVVLLISDTSLCSVAAKLNYPASACNEYMTTDVSGSDVSGSDVSGSDVSGSDVSGSDVSGSDVSGSDVSGSDVSGSDVSGSDVSGSDVSGSDVSGSDVSGSDVSGTDVSENELKYQLKYKVNEDGVSVTVTGFTGEAVGKLIIPDYIDKLPVTGIGNYAFYKCNQLTGRLIIPSSVKKIGLCAFSDCRGFSGELLIPDTVIEIGGWAFSNCSGFSGELVIPDNVATIGKYAFYKCSGFTGDLIIPNSVTSIGEWAFASCSGFSGKLVLSDAITSIEKCLFYECSGFTGDLCLPSNVENIGEHAFAYCEGLSGKLIIPKSVSSIGQYIIRKVSGIKQIENQADIIFTIEQQFDNPNKEYWYDTVSGKRVKSIKKGHTAERGHESGPCHGGYATCKSKAICVECGQEYGELNLNNHVDVDRDFVCDLCGGDAFKAGIWVRNIADYSYTGKKINPIIEVFDYKKELLVGEDYSSKVTNNINVGKGKITITGKGNYSNVETCYFNIIPRSFTDEGVETEDIFLNATGKKQTPKPIVMWNGKKLSSNSYTYSYYLANDEGEPVGNPMTSVKTAGNYLIVIKGKGNFKDVIEENLVVTDEYKLLSKCKISKIGDQRYSGEKIEPGFTVKDGKKKLEKGVDYSVTYENNTEVGMATAIISGMGNYVGTKKVNFSIVGIPMKTVSVFGLVEEELYTGEEIRFDNLSLYIKATKTTPQIILTEGVDYEVYYENNKSAGKGVIAFKGLGGYTGTLKKTFVIDPYNVRYDLKNKIIVNVDESVLFSKGGAKPNVSVIYKINEDENMLLEEGQDYTLSFSGNTSVNDKSLFDKIPTVKIKFQGNYSGTTSRNFKIEAKDMSSLNIYVSDMAYSTKKGSAKSSVVITDTDGKQLKLGTDFNVKYFYENGDSVGEKDIVNVGTTICVKAIAKSGGNYYGELNSCYKITKALISDTTVNVASKYYTGNEILLSDKDITIKYSTKKLVPGLDYEIVEGSYKNNINKGTATVEIRGLGKYGGIKTVSFKIKAKIFRWWK